MRLAHLADLHQGHRMYERQNPDGADVREVDVARAFDSAITDIIDQRCQVALIAGDLFHAVRPPNSALIAARLMFRRLVSAMPVVIVPGNHETPRSRDTKMILSLFEDPGLHIVAYEPKSIRIGDLNIGCYPHIPPGFSTIPPVPDSAATWNVMLAHLAVDGGAQPWHGQKWDYVALGDYHVAHEVEPGVWYSGSPEYVSTNPWGEMIEERERRGASGKGWLLVDLTPEGPKVEFRPVATRRFVDLPTIDATGLFESEINLQLRANIEDGQIADAVVRQVVTNLSKETRRSLDHEIIRRARQTALHFHFDPRRPTTARIGMSPTARHQAVTLEDLIVAALDKRQLPPHIDRERLKDKAREYMVAAHEPEVR